MNLSLHISAQDNASPFLQRKIAVLSPVRLAKIIGPRCRDAVRKHLLANGKNKYGWPSTGFWLKAERSVQLSDNGDGSISISINKIGVAQRYYGGPINAIHAKALTIPICAKAYGKTAADFPNAFLVKTLKGAYLAESFGKGRNAQTVFLFRLTPRVDQPADHTVIPNNAELAQVAIKAITEATA